MPESRLPDVLVLASGGVETATLLHAYAAAGERPLALFLNYGQRPAAPERRAVADQCARLDLDREELDLSSIAGHFRDAHDRQFHVPLPHRNLVALSLALSLAERRAIPRLAVGLTADDAAATGSASDAFLAHFRDLTAELSAITAEAPLAKESKAEVVERGMQLGVDFALSYSCLLGYERPCGRCPQCRKRAAAFASADRADPAQAG
jgi:7-cyano-7-deazaguanine synthase